MRKVVIDASAVLKWYLPDESRDERALSLLEGFVRGEVYLSAPSILPYELLNALIIAARRGRIGAESGTDAYQGFLALGIDVVEVANKGADVLVTALESGLTAYDAAYLSLALREKAELATSDRRLAKAAGACGARVFLI